ncbi:hypothetical protein AYO21_11159 [Fonsecaea monophora]|uniref:RanBD1 domain-containing protein n=1 Tax=Fonsecaea monophora TaxID=254056 RepID=A0A177ETQ5_9EURO|nr:hypothetical protein AYO21_11159 [Fonsecaea monophora]KAH0847425.1 hypothetical protein FOPE_00584 [Fonsecaea pedrosoi]OAG34680.1 hypothetical protein AYO21_11159 [Fonsecaea monophora]
MPKRVADEYITKDNGSIANNPTADEKPKMSTAAQQARRKIATPRGRLGANRSSHPSSSFGASNPFAQSTTQQQPFPTVNGGVAFGTTQSFPPASAGTSSSFNFQPPQASSFTFGAPAGTPNPFANVNGSADAQDISMESPQKKPAFGSAFGSNSFTFGQPAGQQSSAPFSGFGGTSSANTNGTSLFGQSTKPAEAPAPTNLFTQPSQSQPLFAFGQSSSTTEPQTPAFSFGQSTSVPQSPLPAFGTKQGSDTQPPASKFAFGQTSTAPQSQGPGQFGLNVPASQSVGSSLFPATLNETTNTGFPKSTSIEFSFGQTSAQTPSTSTPFANPGSAKAEDSKAASSLFSAGNTSQPSLAPQQQASSPEKPAASESSAQPVNPFAGLFATASGSTPAFPTSKPAFNLGTASQSSMPVAEQRETTTTKSPFGFGTTVQPKSAANESEPKPASSTFNFGSTTAATPSTASAVFGGAGNSGRYTAQSETPKAGPPLGITQGDAAAKPLFNFTTPSKPASGGELFSASKGPEEGKATSTSLFNKLSNAVESSPQPFFNAQPKATQEKSQPQTATTSLFPSARNSGVDKGERSAATSTQSSPTPTIFSGLSQPGPQQSQATEKSASTSINFPAPAVRDDQPTTGELSLSAGAAVGAAQKPSEGAQGSAMDLEPVKRPVYTKAPSRVPGHTTPQQFQEFDRDYRLHSLNYGLQKKIATLDPRSQDFEHIIRHYVAARDSIGASLGLFVRNVAGMKRKADRVDDHEETEQNKKTRETSSQTPPSFGSQLTPVSSGPSAPVANNSAKGSQIRSTTAGMLKDKAPTFGSNSISGPANAGFKPNVNPFAGLASTATTDASPYSGAHQITNTPSSVPSTTPTKPPPKPSTFEVPKFGSGSTNFLAAFGQKAKANADKFERDLIEKRKAEEFDSDEDDEETFRQRIEEETRAKKAKIDAVAKAGFKPTFGSSTTAPPSKERDILKASSATFIPSASPNPFSALTSKGVSVKQADPADAEENENSGSSHDQAAGSEEEDSDDDSEAEEPEDDLPEDDVAEENGEGEDEDDDDNDLGAAMDRAKNNPNAGKSLFDRIEPNPNKEKATPTNGEKNNSDMESTTIQPTKNSSFQSPAFGSQVAKSTPENSSGSLLSSSTGASTPKPTGGFQFTPIGASTTPTSAPGASIFSGGATRQGPVPGEGLFGSRPSTPSNADKNPSLAKSVLTSPAGTDNTWKEGAPISFANGDNSTSAPVFKFTAASPGEKEKDSATSKSLSTLFGTTGPGSRGSDTPSLGFQFGAPTPSPAPGYLGAISHLGGGSVASSVVSSRATSPGLTDNESVATNETDESTDDPQTSLMDSRAGEENETCLWEGRSKALMFVNTEAAKGTKHTPNDWNSMGVGQIRVLKNNDNDKTRVVFRVEPSANILFNSHLVGSTNYESVPSNKSGAVRGALMYKGNLTRLVFKLKTPEMASELAKILEQNKSA